MSVVDQLQWQKISDYTSAKLTLTNDLVADEDLVVDASSLAPLDPCPPGSKGICKAPAFRQEAYPSRTSSGLRGLTCITANPASPGYGTASCAKVAIAKGTTFRLRATVQQLGPGFVFPFIEFAQACTVPCSTNETRCVASQTCFPKGAASCALCAGSARDICACSISDTNSEANGTACYFDLSGDVSTSGICDDGRCVHEQAN